MLNGMIDENQPALKLISEITALLFSKYLLQYLRMQPQPRPDNKPKKIFVK